VSDDSSCDFELDDPNFRPSVYTNLGAHPAAAVPSEPPLDPRLGQKAYATDEQVDAFDRKPLAQNPSLEAGVIVLIKRRLCTGKIGTLMIVSILTNIFGVSALSNHGSQVEARGPGILSEEAAYQLLLTWEAYHNSFPHGSIRIPTQATALMCGFYALTHSIMTQAPQVPVPCIEQFRVLAAHNDGQEFSTNSQGYAPLDEDNFRADVIASVLTRWGAEQVPSFNLRIGFVVGNGSLYRFSVVDAPNEIAIWVYNDGLNLDEEGELLGHFEGLRPERLQWPPAIRTNNTQVLPDHSDTVMDDISAIESAAQAPETAAPTGLTSSFPPFFIDFYSKRSWASVLDQCG
jgi:hypothetical protein